MTADWHRDVDGLRALLHDLRTPLAAVLGLATTLERGDVAFEPGEAKDLASRIAANARTLDRMIGDLLDLDRLVRREVELTAVPSDLAQLVARVVQESDVMEGRTVEIDAEPATAEVDPSKVERMVENLLSNSVRHSSPEGTVSIRVRRQDSGALIAVEDRGPGIPPPFREAVFQPFAGGPAAEDFPPGAGIGLALVAGFAELHGGRAWVEDRDGGGASFRVWLPERRPSSAG
jgi:signal transduction histidine kinase